MVKEVLIGNGKCESGICSIVWDTALKSDTGQIVDGPYKIWAKTSDGINNSEQVDVMVDNTAPLIKIAEYITSQTNQDITVTATTNEGTLNATSHTFTANGSFDFIATDEAGNITIKIVNISNIDKTPLPGPIIVSRGGGGGSFLSILPLNTTPTTPVGKVLGATDFKFSTYLEKGMTHNDVRELQERLTTEGFFTITPSIKYFGVGTFKSVKAYQKAHNLPSTGFVGPLTIAELNK